jgi:hypothetical protein
VEENMKKIAVVLVLSFIAVSAHAMKPCEELKSEIEAKLDAKGVKNYKLEIVPNKEVKDQKVVGSCDGGTKKITYQRGAAPPAKPATGK